MTKDCDIVCTFKPIILFMNLIGKKLMVNVILQNTVKPLAVLSPLGEVLTVASIKQVMVLSSVESSSSFALIWVNKVS